MPGADAVGREPPRPGARPHAGRQPRLRQPLPRGAGGGRGPRRARPRAPSALGPGQVVVMIHSGSRGFGHQVCTDHWAGWRARRRAPASSCPTGSSPARRSARPRRRELPGRHGLRLQLRLRQPADDDARGARRVRAGVRRELGAARRGAGLRRGAQHRQARGARGRRQRSARVRVHRKGATRASAPAAPTSRPDYRAVGQPVIIPGDMGTRELAAGGHGDGDARDLRLDLPRRGPPALPARGPQGQRAAPRCGASWRTPASWSRRPPSAVLAEEAPYAYKDVADVVDVVDAVGLSRKVARLRPLGVLKG